MLVTLMGIILVKISDETEKKLREAAIMRFGAKKGSLSKAVEEAINMWIDSLKISREEKVDWDTLRVRVKDKKLTEKLLEESKKVDKKRISKMLEVLGLEDK